MTASDCGDRAHLDAEWTDALDETLCTHRIIVSKSGKRKPVHGALLQKSSCYFDALFRYEIQREIRLPLEQFGFLTCGLSLLIDCTHGGVSRLKLTEENCLDAYMTADFLLHPELRARALHFIRARAAASVDFALAIWSAADAFFLPELSEIAFEEVLCGFPSVCMATQSWLALTPNQVHTVLSHDSLNCPSECLVLGAVQCWLGADSERWQHAERLVACARLGLLKQGDEASDALSRMGAADRRLSKMSKQSSLSNLLSLWRPDPTATPRQPHQAVLVLGGWGREPTVPGMEATGPQAACQVFNPRANSWTFLTPDSSRPPSDIGQIGRRVYAGCLCVGDLVHLVGGFDGQRALRTVSCYNLRRPDLGWYEGSCMLFKRYYVCCASAGDILYAIGGHSGELEPDSRLDTVEQMSVRDNIWKQIASLRVVRSDAGAASIGDRVFVAGGFDGVQYHNSAEMYDPRANQWTLIHCMSFRRGGVALVSLGNALYAIGGNDGTERLRAIEKYVPESDEWIFAGQLSKPKSNLSAATIDDTCLLVIGGWSDEGDRGVLASVEKFSPDTGAVVSVADLGFAASATAACTVRGRQLAARLLMAPQPALRNP